MLAELTGLRVPIAEGSTTCRKIEDAAAEVAKREPAGSPAEPVAVAAGWQVAVRDERRAFGPVALDVPADRDSVHDEGWQPAPDGRGSVAAVPVGRCCGQWRYGARWCSPGQVWRAKVSRGGVPAVQVLLVKVLLVKALGGRVPDGVGDLPAVADGVA